MRENDTISLGYGTNLQRVEEEWNGIADSDWYMSYRKQNILQKPISAFHQKTWEVIHAAFPDLEGRNVLNAICDAGLSIRRLEEMHDERDKGHFWFYEEERKKMCQEEIDAYYDFEKNPLSALPQWFTVCCVKQ